MTKTNSKANKFNFQVAQMSMQEEIIAKRKMELLEKQKTAELAKQVQAAQSGGKSSKKDTKAAHTQYAWSGLVGFSRLISIFLL